MTHVAPLTESRNELKNNVCRTGRSSLRLRLLSGAALALSTVSFAALERAEAACTPNSPVSNTTVTCSGTTTNQNGPTFGYGNAVDVGNTINVQSGASVTGDEVGLIFHNGTVNNLGLIEATGAGPNAFGFFAVDSATIHNTGGTIKGASIGIDVNSAATLDNGTGTVTGVNTGSSGEHPQPHHQCRHDRGDRRKRYRHGWLDRQHHQQ